MKSQRTAFMIAAAAAVLAALFFLLPKTNCCDKPDAALEQLNDRASAGDMNAIRALYQKARADGVEHFEETWALEGALRGDAALRLAYADIFMHRMNQAQQEHAMTIIRDRPLMPGAECLAALLATGTAGGHQCT